MERLEKALLDTFERLRGIVERCETLCDTMRVYCDQARADANRARVERKFTVDSITSALEIANDLGLQSGTLKARIKAMGEKETLRAGLDNWFWRPEPDTVLEFQLKKRLSYLYASQYNFDQAWDLLVEYIAGWTGAASVDEELLRKVFISSRYNQKRSTPQGL